MQIAAMANRFPTLRLVGKTQPLWRGDIVPIEGGRAFTLEVHSMWDRRPIPRVRVLAPALVAVPGGRLPPHTYDDGTLCLYHTDDFRWDGSQYIATTIVPWACAWCFYYELWLATGEWLGPEYPHGGRKRSPTAIDAARDPNGRAA
jgi:hypothetical protein